MHGTVAYEGTKGVCPADLTAATWKREIKETALRCFQLIGCRDYARVDFRLTADRDAVRARGQPESRYLRRRRVCPVGARPTGSRSPRSSARSSNARAASDPEHAVMPPAPIRSGRCGRTTGIRSRRCSTGDRHVFTDEEIGIALELIDTVLDTSGTARLHHRRVMTTVADRAGLLLHRPDAGNRRDLRSVLDRRRPAVHGRGIGRRLERACRGAGPLAGGRRLIVAETSSQPKYEPHPRCFTCRQATPSSRGSGTTTGRAMILSCTANISFITRRITGTHGTLAGDAAAERGQRQRSGRAVRLRQRNSQNSLNKLFHIRINPYYLSLIRYPGDPIWLQCIPGREGA